MALFSRTEVLDAPAYTLADAAQLLDLSYQQVRAWFKGTRVSKPLISSQGARAPIPTLSFLDVVELRVVTELLKLNVSMRDIVRIHQWRAKRDPTRRPYASQPIFLLGAKSAFFPEGDQLVEANTAGQLGIREIIEENADKIDPRMFYLRDNELEFDTGSGLVDKWWPMSTGSDVVIDPARSFGAPILSHYRIKTSSVYDMYVAEDERLDTVTDWFDINEKAASDAISFEKRLRHAA